MSKEQEIRALLQENFGFLEEGVRMQIAAHSELLDLESGDLIIDVGRYIKMIPLIVKGSVKVMREDNEGQELLLYYLEEGHTCATSFSCCMGNKKSNIRAEVVEPTKLIGVPVQKMEAWMAQYPTWRNFLMTTYEFRFNELLETVDQLAFKKLDQRLTDYLAQKKQRNDNSTITISHQQIAYDLNTSREVISRLLKKLESDGYIQLHRGKIEILAL